MVPPLTLIRVALLLVGATFANAAQAQFQSTDGETYIYTGERNFEVEIRPDQPPTVSAYAIIDKPIAFYVIFSANRFNYEPLGAFQCNKEFALLKTHSNGLYDVRCVNETPTNKNDASILRFDGTIYQQIY